MMGLKFILTAVITLAMTMLHAAGNVSAAERSTDDPDAVVSEIPKAAKIKTPDEETIKKGELLTLQRCLEIALKRQPNIIAARNIVTANESRVGQAKANYYPQLDVSSGYSKIAPVPTATSLSSNAVDQYTSSIGLKQNIYDFGKTSTQVKIQKFNTDAAKLDLESVSEQIVFNVKQAYYGVLQARKNRTVTEEAVMQFEHHLGQAKGFFEMGIRSKFDVTKAEVDLSAAKLNLIRADNAFKIAIVSLNNAMGVIGASDYVLEDILEFKNYEIIFDDATAKAFGNRNDMQAIAARRKALEENVELAKTNYYPALTGNAAYNWGGSKFPLEDGWNVGATITLPIFSGFLTKNQIAEAEANLNVIKANEDLLRQNVYFEVQQAFLNLKEAESRIPTAELAVKQATENLDIANGRYTAGVGNPIEVTDAQVAYSNAKTAYIQALSDYKVAQAALEKAMGVR
ncbi:MAG TPA: TolC family protein [Nitrospiraceae bacterium]|nr:MAG: hypothetical protein A2Z82_06310 [Nitrospirae bacterium GWA2_46_11]OGW23280.1 MAG: hypothetical protein A2X55_07660 [Nitrospirae bacterium GWB2_47_37]HAK88542.1 TolC family protein [Nitrospiraceae bacterium]HCZ12196.1 TolC family protein [Nitrospiraceae bacterium]